MSWEKVKVLGEGRFGRVEHWRKNDQEIAVKFFITPNLRKTREEDEVRILREMNHENIVAVKDIPEDLEKEISSNDVFLGHLFGMEFCALGDLRRHLRNNPCGLKESDLRSLLSDLTSAITYFHGRKIIHRDLKPENIVLRQHPNLENQIQFKITDVGLVKDLNKYSCAHSYVGTALYLAPEIQMQDSTTRRYSYEVDFWGFGIILFESICGFYPFGVKYDIANTLRLIARKENKDIGFYIKPITDKHKTVEAEYFTEIPNRFQISKPLIKNLCKLLQSMFCLNALDRGKIDGMAWSEFVEKILGLKYVVIFNTSSMHGSVFEISKNTTLHSLQIEIENFSKICVNDQILLTENGEEIVENMLQNLPQNFHVYLYSTTQVQDNCPVDFHVPDCDNTSTADDRSQKLLSLLNGLNCIFKQENIFHQISKSTFAVHKTIVDLPQKMHEVSVDLKVKEAVFNSQMKQHRLTKEKYIKLCQMDEENDDMTNAVLMAEKELDEIEESIQSSKEALNEIGESYKRNHDTLVGVSAFHAKVVQRYHMWNLEKVKNDVTAMIKSQKFSSLNVNLFLQPYIKPICEQVRLTAAGFKSNLPHFIKLYKFVTQSTKWLESVSYDLAGCETMPKQENLQDEIWSLVLHLKREQRNIYDESQKVDNNETGRELVLELSNHLEEIIRLQNEVISDKHLGDLSEKFL